MMSLTNPDPGVMAVYEYVDEFAQKLGWNPEGQKVFLSDTSFELRYIKNDLSISVKFLKAKLHIKVVNHRKWIPHTHYTPVDLAEMIQYYNIDLADPACFNEYRKLLKRV